MTSSNQNYATLQASSMYNKRGSSYDVEKKSAYDLDENPSYLFHACFKCVVVIVCKKFILLLLMLMLFMPYFQCTVKIVICAHHINKQTNKVKIVICAHNSCRRFDAILRFLFFVFIKLLLFFSCSSFFCKSIADYVI